MNRRAVRNISSAPRPGSKSVRPVGADERVAAQPFDVDGAGGDPGQVGVPPDVVQVVDREHARQQRGQPAHPARHRRIGQRRLGDEERDPVRIDRLALREGVALADVSRGPAQAAQERPELLDDDPDAQVLVGEPLGARPARIGRRLEVGEDVVVEEVGERSVAHVVEEAGHAQGLGDQALGRERRAIARRGKGGAQARIERARPQPGLVHDPEAVGEARVLGRREDPACALQLADPAQPLQPGRVEEVLLGDVLGGQPGRRRFSRR